MKQKATSRVSMVVFSLIVFFACDQARKEEGLRIIPVEEAYRSQTTLNASDYFRKVRYVPLETTDQSLVGKNPTVWIAGDKLIVSSEQRQCLAFDKATGRFIASIGHVGNDPEGSLSLSGWMNAKAGHIYFQAGNGRSVIYDTAGNFVGERRDLEITEGLFGVDTYDYLDENVLVEHLPATDKKPDRVILFRDTTLLGSFPSHGERLSPLSGDVSDIQSINVRKHPEAGFDVIYMTLKDGRQNALVPSEQIFWHKGKDLFFRETFNDTIYQVGLAGLRPVARFDLGSMRWDRKDRYAPDKDRAIYPLDIYENECLLWLRFVVGLYHPDRWEVYNAVYDKRSGEMKAAPFKEGMLDDQNGFLPLQPTFAAAEGEFAQIVPITDVTGWFEDHAGQADCPEAINALRGLTEEDNPIVILME